MGSAGYRIQQVREETLGQILKEDYKYLVALVGVNNETNKSVRGAYCLFKEKDETRIREYASMTSKENNIKLAKIEIWSLEAKLLEEWHP